MTEPSGTAPRRVHVNFSDDAWSVLKEKHKTVSEILRDALALEKWFSDLSANGGRLIVERADGTRREIVER